MCTSRIVQSYTLFLGQFLNQMDQVLLLIEASTEVGGHPGIALVCSYYGVGHTRTPLGSRLLLIVILSSQQVEQ